MANNLIKILLIEDYKEDIENYIFLLEKIFDQCQILEANSAKKAYKILQENQNLNLIILDYNLPDATGLEIIQHILEEQSIPIIALTGMGDENIAIDFMKAGASDYITKSNLSISSMQRSISNALDKHKLNLLARSKQEELYNFSHTIAHDLRAPLGRMQIYIDLIKKSPDKSEKYLSYIKDDNLFCLQFLDKLLEYAEAGRDFEITEQIELSEIFERVIKNLKLPIEQKQAVIEIDKNFPRIKGDLISIIQLFQNIISNAIKFNNSIPNIKITHKTTEEHIYIKCEDNGIGIPQDKIDNIFKPFSRLCSTDEFAGNGIGLATCKIIADQHSAEIIIESTPNIGSIFIVKFKR